MSFDTFSIDIPVTGGEPRERVEFRHAQIIQLREWLDSRSMDQAIHITISPKLPTRRKIQNRLYHATIADVVMQTSFNEAQVYGMSKLNVLLHVKKTFPEMLEEADLEHRVMRAVLSNVDITHAEAMEMANAVIRSSTLSVKCFARFIDALMQHWAESAGVCFSHNAFDILYAVNGVRSDRK